MSTIFKTIRQQFAFLFTIDLSSISHNPNKCTYFCHLWISLGKIPQISPNKSFPRIPEPQDTNQIRGWLPSTFRVLLFHFSFPSMGQCICDCASLLFPLIHLYHCLLSPYSVHLLVIAKDNQIRDIDILVIFIVAIPIRNNKGIWWSGYLVHTQSGIHLGIMKSSLSTSLSAETAGQGPRSNIGLLVRALTIWDYQGFLIPHQNSRDLPWYHCTPLVLVA